MELKFSENIQIIPFRATRAYNNILSLLNTFEIFNLRL